MKFLKRSIILAVLVSLLYTPLVVATGNSIEPQKITLFEVTREVTNFIMDDGVEISGTVHFPAVNQVESFPPIIFSNSWVLPKQEYETMCYRFARQGYVVYSYALRGWHSSNNNGSEIDVIGPRSMKDLGIIMDKLENKRFDNAIVDSGKKFTLIGISQGGLNSLNGAVYHTDRINSVIVMSGCADLYEALYGNNTPRTAYINMLISTAHKYGTIEATVEDVLLPGLLKHENLDTIKEYTNKRSAMHKDNLAKLNNADIPIYIMANFDDALFNPNLMMYFFDKLTVSKKRLDFSYGSHATHEFFGMFGFDTVSWDNAVDWVNHMAKGEKNNILSTKVSFENKPLFYREHFDTWPTDEIKTKTFYLSEKRKFLFFENIFDVSMENSPSKINAGSKTITNGDSGFDTATNTIERILIAHTRFNKTNLIPTLNKKHCAVFKSDILTKQMVLTGMPKVSLWVKPLSKEIRLVAHLFSVDPVGLSEKFKSIMPYTKYNCEIGKPIKIEFDLTMIASYIPPGHRVGLTIDTYDPQFENKEFPEDFSFEILYSDEYPSKLILPFVE